jgi:predicted RNase H-like nuclease (RuvC/YqgF family)
LNLDKHLTLHIISFVVGGWQSTTEATNAELHANIHRLELEASILNARINELQNANEIMKERMAEQTESVATLKAMNDELQKANEILKRRVEELEVELPNDKKRRKRESYVA